jgi:hypothetical protein
VVASARGSAKQRLCASPRDISRPEAVGTRRRCEASAQAGVGGAGAGRRRRGEAERSGSQRRSSSRSF